MALIDLHMARLAFPRSDPMGPRRSALSAGRPLDFMLAGPKHLILLSWFNRLETPACCFLVPDAGTETQGLRHTRSEVRFFCHLHFVA